MSEPIAIVGMAGTYAGASNKDQFWSNVLNKVDAVSDAPEDWLGPFFDADSDANDRIYNRKGGFLRGGASFNPMRYGIMPRAVDGGEPDQFLALKLASDALEDAGYLDADFDRSRAGVILGRGTYINRGYTNLLQHGLVIDQTLQLLAQARPDLGEAELRQVRKALKAQLPPFNTEMAPGLVPNVTSGLIANRLNLMGPNYILDAACASTLIALDHAVRELQSGRADLMISGGVQASTPPQIVMIFCQLGAISRGPLRPFSNQAGGTLLGEGAGLFVLKRLSDAQRDEDRIYAVIRGIGSSSDGKAKGLLAPRPEGEVLAIRRGYENAGVDPASVDLIECHGTGIPLGDATEIGSLRAVFGERTGPAPRIAIGSVKSMIAHCLPAAGSAALMKTALALHHQVLPPTLCEEVSPELELESSAFYVNTETRPWLHDPRSPRRAGINAFGFGGVNSHLVVEEYQPHSQRALVQMPVRLQEHDAELFCFAAASRDDLAAQLDQAIAAADGGAFLTLQSHPAQAEHRAAVAATSPADLSKKLKALRKRLDKATGFTATRGGAAYGVGAAPGKLALLFPGEGAQYPGMLESLARRFPALREWLDFVESNADASQPLRPRDALVPAPTALNDGQRASLESRLYEMDMASESIFAASAGLLALLRQCQVQPDAIIGHSTGEHAALVAAGAFGEIDAEGLRGLTRTLNTVYQKLLSQGQIATGVLLTVGALDAAAREAALEPFAQVACVAMDNCPNQAVIFVAEEHAAAVEKALVTAGGIVASLPFDRAYHTEHFAPVTQAFRQAFAQVHMQPTQVPVLSCASLDWFPSDADTMRDLACAQWSQPVRFRQAVQTLLDAGVSTFVEVGPSANLSAFVQDSLKAHDGQAISIATNSRRQDDQQGLLAALGQIWVAGHAVDLAPVLRAAEANSVEEPKPDPALATVLPMLHWPEDLVPDWQPRSTEQESVVASAPVSSPDPALVTNGLNVAPAQQPRSVTPTAERPAVSPAAALPLAPEPGQQPVLQQHFSLMQEFLAQQSRVLAAMERGGVGTASAVSHPATSHGPLLAAAPEVDAEQAQGRFLLDPLQQLYLQDHTLGAAPSLQEAERTALAVVPFTFSLEMAAQLARSLAPQGWPLVGFAKARGQRWLALDHGPRSLTGRAQRLEQGAQQVRVQCELDDGGKGAAFSVVCVFAPAYPAAVAMEPVLANQPIRDNPPDQLYSRGMFHGPRLQGVARLSGWDEHAIAADLVVKPLADCVQTGQVHAWETDPILLDAVGQLAGYWLSEKERAGFNCFPYAIDQIDLYAPPPSAGEQLPSTGRFDATSATTFAAHWQVGDGRGGLWANIRGWSDRKFAVDPRFTRWRSAPQSQALSQGLDTGQAPLALRWLPAQPDDFWAQAGGIWLRVAAHLSLSSSELVQFYSLEGMRQQDWLLGRLAAKEAIRDLASRWGQTLALADLTLGYAADGRPQVEAGDLARPVTISIAHHQGQAVAVAADASLAVGVDLVCTQNLDTDSIARTALGAAEREQWLGLQPDQRADFVARVWAAKEAAAKAVGSGLQGRPDQWQVQTQAAAQQVRGPQGQQLQWQSIDIPQGVIALALSTQIDMERQSA
nr:acyltransferase domain-containing protein [Oceanococcus sp. HetDA_MAG_MS8]